MTVDDKRLREERAERGLWQVPARLSSNVSRQERQ